ncbi:RimK family alpha-L-glutamate ligase [Azospirillum sp. TSO35-2]|uniref:RimK family alpha-L-glutamate ligase n=1 Tax=Azospirillum sp. TSO35-2 TaxID=716796 RepID=UPI000D61F126|nr:RimK family alpha-L-glutamate ligase [Azospirillum sp. TSO35-2]PWC37861.1 alpha-L-glutamate ligase [Azospirillum sp. TSO35-2]
MTDAIALFTDGADWHAARLARAIERRGVECRRVSLNACGFAVGRTATGLHLPGFGDALPLGAFVRVVGQGSFEQVTLRLGVLHALDRLGVPVYNGARAIERCVDKSTTSFLLAQAGIPTPPAVAVQTADAARAAVEEWPDCVLKPLFGAQGRGLRRLSRPDEVPEPEAMAGVYYLQPFVPPLREGAWRDCRVFVVGGVAVAAMIRHGRSWITNVHQGARCEPFRPDGVVADLAVRAAAVVGADYAGVDLIAAPERDSDSGWLVLEVNSMPAWQGLQTVSDTDIAGCLADDFLRRVGAAALVRPQ